jgi:tetratricopeptide (TPR) repeat protein
MGRYYEAIKVLSPLYSKYPKGYTLNLRFGWLYFLSKRYSDAIKYYTKASLINTYALDPRLGLIRIYLQTANYEKAQTVSYELLKIDYYN